jgi:hypothetical protein
VALEAAHEVAAHKGLSHLYAAARLGPVRAMMFAIFAALLVAFLFDLAGWRRLAVASLAASLVLCIALFAWEIYSPDYGFRMPWLEVELDKLIPPARGA